MSFDYEAHDAMGLAACVAVGEVTPDALLDAALERVALWNDDLTAVVLIDEGLARAKIASGLPDGPLKGVPFLIKDIGCETPDFPVSMGSKLGQGTRHDQHSSIYARFLAAGLVPFGRTATPEGAVGSVTEAVAYGAPTRNPWDLSHSPGGSSGGAAAAVAARIVPAAHGSDGGGSIRTPASCCGLFGFKPSRGRVPDGPYAGEGWAGMAQDGVLTRSVRDTALLLDVLAGPDLGAPYFPPPMSGSYAQAARARPGKQKIAVCCETLTGEAIHPACRAAVEDAASLLGELGHDVIEARPNAPHEAMQMAWTKIVACGSASWIRRLADRKGVKAEAHVEYAMQGALKMAESVTGADYLDAVEEIHAFGRAMAAFFAEFDVFLCASLAEPPAQVGRFAHSRPEFEDFAAYRTGSAGVFAYSPFTAAFNASGQPAMSVPLHWSAEGLPIGIHLAASMGADEMLMSLASQLEEARPWAARGPKLQRA